MGGWGGVRRREGGADGGADGGWWEWVDASWECLARGWSGEGDQGGACYHQVHSLDAVRTQWIQGAGRCGRESLRRPLRRPERLHLPLRICDQFVETVPCPVLRSVCPLTEVECMHDRYAIQFEDASEDSDYKKCASQTANSTRTSTGTHSDPRLGPLVAHTHIHRKTSTWSLTPVTPAAPDAAAPDSSHGTACFSGSVRTPTYLLHTSHTRPHLPCQVYV